MTIKELKDRIYQDFISSFKNAITPLRASFFEQLSNTLSSAFQLIYIYLNNIQKDSFLTTCTGNRVLEYFAPLKNVTRKEATVSRGIIRFTGVDGSVIPSGTILTYNELEYITIEDATISSGFTDVSSTSVETGDLTNTLSNIDLFLSVPIAGIDNKAISIQGFTAAIDEETIESLRTRVKQRFGTTTEIDNDNFYKALANEIPSVKAAFVSSIKNGVGTFGITILTKNGTGIPIQTDIDELKQYFIDNAAIPSYVEAEYFIPTIVSQNFTLLTADNSPSNRANIEQSLRDYLYLFQIPGETFQFSGLSDFLQTIGARLNNPDPTSDIVLAKNEVLDVGTITWI